MKEVKKEQEQDLERETLLSPFVKQSEFDRDQESLLRVDYTRELLTLWQRFAGLHNIIGISDCLLIFPLIHKLLAARYPKKLMTSYIAISFVSLPIKALLYIPFIPLSIAEWAFKVTDDGKKLADLSLTLPVQPGIKRKFGGFRRDRKILLKNTKMPYYRRGKDRPGKDYFIDWNYDDTNDGQLVFKSNTEVIGIIEKTVENRKILKEVMDAHAHRLLDNKSVQDFMTHNFISNAVLKFWPVSNEVYMAKMFINYMYRLVVGGSLYAVGDDEKEIILTKDVLDYIFKLKIDIEVQDPTYSPKNSYPFYRFDRKKRVHAGNMFWHEKKNIPLPDLPEYLQAIEPYLSEFSNEFKMYCNNLIIFHPEPLSKTFERLNLAAPENALCENNDIPDIPVKIAADKHSIIYDLKELLELKANDEGLRTLPGTSELFRLNELGVHSRAYRRLKSALDNAENLQNIDKPGQQYSLIASDNGENLTNMTL